MSGPLTRQAASGTSSWLWKHNRSRTIEPSNSNSIVGTPRPKFGVGRLGLVKPPIVGWPVSSAAFAKCPIDLAAVRRRLARYHPTSIPFGRTPKVILPKYLNGRFSFCFRNPVAPSGQHDSSPLPPLFSCICHLSRYNIQVAGRDSGAISPAFLFKPHGAFSSNQV